jgi:hypothetical protein
VRLQTPEPFRIHDPGCPAGGKCFCSPLTIEHSPESVYIRDLTALRQYERETLAMIQSLGVGSWT